jgi:hypothetical protein
MCSNHLFLHQMFSKNYFWVKPLAEASCYCHLTSGSSDFFFAGQYLPELIFSKCYLIAPNALLFYLVIFNEKPFQHHTCFQKPHAPFHTTYHTLTKCVNLKRHLHTCTHAYMSMIVIRVEYWLLDCLNWIDCEEEQGYYCNCCECASCYQGKWHTYPSPILLCISIFTSCSMHDRCFTQLFYQMLRP